MHVRIPGLSRSTKVCEVFCPYHDEGIDLAESVPTKIKQTILNKKWTTHVSERTLVICRQMEKAPKRTHCIFSPQKNADGTQYDIHLNQFTQG